MSRICINGIRAQAVLGVREHEKKTPQPISINLSFLVDVDRAALHDQLSDTSDYSLIAKSTLDFVTQIRCQLLETLAKKLQHHLKREFQLNGLQITITKHPSDMLFVDEVKIITG